MSTIITKLPRIFKWQRKGGVRTDSTAKPQYPELNRTAFLIEHASVPRYYPIYCAEMAQLLAGIEARLRESQPNNHSKGQDGYRHPAH